MTEEVDGITRISDNTNSTTYYFNYESFSHLHDLPVDVREICVPIKLTRELTSFGKLYCCLFQLAHENDLTNEWAERIKFIIEKDNKKTKKIKKKMDLLEIDMSNITKNYIDLKANIEDNNIMILIISGVLIVILSYVWYINYI